MIYLLRYFLFTLYYTIIGLICHSNCKHVWPKPDCILILYRKMCLCLYLCVRRPCVKPWKEIRICVWEWFYVDIAVRIIFPSWCRYIGVLIHLHINLIAGNLIKLNFIINWKRTIHDSGTYRFDSIHYYIKISKHYVYVFRKL